MYLSYFVSLYMRFLLCRGRLKTKKGRLKAQLQRSYSGTK
ncbi:hypothetical protein HMPREF9123_0812 [Neisseria bacilliformis ATCC BAA-1200]|uniref:Uncharacterized protein n=1 Tax=Neisseria bacilliformis ATCC BAA-1200 TaxID=888742 RepID=F2BAQ8_9NEIS|nr:hypothetical protein HMPREF9123_0812 [Neisseria bacilliformis ATCC BAA-1200]